MLTTFEFVPGAVAANTPISLPSNTVKFYSLSRVEVVTLSDGTVAGAISTKSVVTGTPAAGQCKLVDEGTIQPGDATTNRDIIRLTGLAYGTCLRAS